MNECRLIYRSKAGSDFSSTHYTEEFSKKCSDSNKSKNITGLLVLTHGSFLQAIEGVYEEINQLFCRIAKDPRHTEVQIINFELINMRIFPDWYMKTITIEDLSERTQQTLKEKFGSPEKNHLEIPIEPTLVRSLLLDASYVYRQSN